MSETQSDPRPAESAADPGEAAHSADELRAEIARLAAENERLREAYARSKRSAYRRSAAGLAGLGVLAVAGGLVLPPARAVLFVLGAIGLFGAVLTTFLTPERFVAASVGQAVYSSLADNEAALAAELGLSEDHRYVPAGPARGVRLFIPQAGTDAIPAAGDLQATLVATRDATGLALDPSGSELLREFEASLGGDLADEPQALAGQLAEALAEQFELVRSADPDVDPADGRVSVSVTDSAYGRLDRFDHPIPSFLAAGLARGIGEPVDLEVTEGDEGWIVTCRWEPDDETEAETNETAAVDEAPETV